MIQYAGITEHSRDPCQVVFLSFHLATSLFSALRTPRPLNDRKSCVNQVWPLREHSKSYETLEFKASSLLHTLELHPLLLSFEGLKVSPRAYSGFHYSESLEQTTSSNYRQAVQYVTILPLVIDAPCGYQSVTKAEAWNGPTRRPPSTAFPCLARELLLLHQLLFPPT